MKPAVFLDRDGVVVENIDGDYIREKSQIRLLPFAKQAVLRMHQHGYEVVIATNQACVNKGIINERQAQSLQAEIIDRLDPMRTMEIKSKLCPHTDNENCICRKPQPGMILSAANEYEIDLSKSYMIGDALSDIQAALSAEVTPVFVLTGRGKSSDIDDTNGNIKVVDHIGNAADYICGVTK